MNFSEKESHVEFLRRTGQAYKQMHDQVWNEESEKLRKYKPE